MAQTQQPSTPETNKAATELGTLPLAQLSLLGTTTGPAGGKAILRTRFGAIHVLPIGGSLNGVKLTAVNDGTVELTRNGHIVTLAIPGS